MKKFTMSKQRLAAFVGSVGVAGLTVCGSAFATLDTSISTGLTAIQSDFTALMAIVYPFMLTILSALIIFGLVKKLAKKSV
jgi:hypothetical protein